MKLFLEKLLDILEALLRFRRRRNGKGLAAGRKKRDRQEKRKKSMT